MKDLAPFHQLKALKATVTRLLNYSNETTNLVVSDDEYYKLLDTHPDKIRSSYIRSFFLRRNQTEFMFNHYDSKYEVSDLGLYKNYFSIAHNYTKGVRTPVSRVIPTLSKFITEFIELDKELESLQSCISECLRTMSNFGHTECILSDFDTSILFQIDPRITITNRVVPLRYRILKSSDMLITLQAIMASFIFKQFVLSEKEQIEKPVKKYIEKNL